MQNFCSIEIIRALEEVEFPASKEDINLSAIRKKEYFRIINRILKPA